MNKYLSIELLASKSSNEAWYSDARVRFPSQVKYVQARDAGVYECQVGTEPKMSHFVQLNVVGECLYTASTRYYTSRIVYNIRYTIL